MKYKHQKKAVVSIKVQLTCNLYRTSEVSQEFCDKVVTPSFQENLWDSP